MRPEAASVNRVTAAIAVSGHDSRTSIELNLSGRKLNLAHACVSYNDIYRALGERPDPPAIFGFAKSGVGSFLFFGVTGSSTPLCVRCGFATHEGRLPSI